MKNIATDKLENFIFMETALPCPAREYKEYIAFLSNMRCSWALGMGHGAWGIGRVRVPHFSENRYKI